MLQHHTLKGIRDSNEDKDIIDINQDKRAVLIGICDGHGGNETSKYISRLMPYLFNNKYLKYPLISKQIKLIFKNIQKKFIKNENNRFDFAYYSGCTCCLVYIRDKYFYSINIGDTRSLACYYNPNSKKIKIKQLSKDHKPGDYEERRRIERKGGFVENDMGISRVQGLAVSRAFGDCDNKYITSEPDIKKYNITRDLKFIVIACDGIFDVLSNERVCDFILQNNYDTNMNLLGSKKNSAKKLCELALQNDTTDNVSCIIYFLN